VNWLDLFCGAGCVAQGLIDAGDTVIGVDINPRAGKYYPGQFMQMDCLRMFQFLQAVKCWPEIIINGKRIDAIWTSPPCLEHTELNTMTDRKGTHPDLITPTRAFLRSVPVPHVIENVPDAPLISPVMLCGSMFRLGVSYEGQWFRLERHRHFETNWPLQRPAIGCLHEGPAVSVIGGHARIRSAAAGGRRTADFERYPAPRGRRHRLVMGRAFGLRDEHQITCQGISDGIPPIYATYVARQLKRHLNV
jgi:DNA (cytosine-5)-methyltransferase 1